MKVLNIMEQLLKYIKANYKEGDPILLKDLKKLNMSYDNLRQKLKKLTDSEYIYRMTDGVYSYGNKSSVEKIIKNRFIERNNKIFGYYTKNKLLSNLGFEVEKEIDEIITNDFSAIVREIEIMGVKIKVRHSKIKINNNNCYVLQLLDLLKDLKNFKVSDKALERKLKEYIIEHKITKNAIDKYINLYPSITFKNYYKYNI